MKMNKATAIGLPAKYKGHDVNILERVNYRRRNVRIKHNNGVEEWVAQEDVGSDLDKSLIAHDTLIAENKMLKRKG